MAGKKDIPGSQGYRDEETGSLVLARFYRPAKYPGNFVRIDTIGIQALRAKTLRHADRTVFLELLHYIENGNVIWIKQSQVAEDLGMSRASVSQAMKRLVEAGVIHRLDQPGGYRMDLEIGFRGSEGLRREMARELAKHDRTD